MKPVQDGDQVHRFVKLELRQLVNLRDSENAMFDDVPHGLRLIDAREPGSMFSKVRSTYDTAPQTNTRPVRINRCCQTR